jgi:hypothetical protein
LAETDIFFRRFILPDAEGVIFFAIKPDYG